MRNKILTILLLGQALTGFKYTEVNAQAVSDSCFAAYVVSYTPGTNKAGAVLTKPDSYETVLGSNNGEEDYLSLGLGGEIVLGFVNPLPTGAGDDLYIQERDGNSSSFPERVDVYVSADGISFQQVGGTVTQTASIDVGTLGFPIKYVKLVDVSIPEELNGDNANGYDLDRVASLHGCGDGCEERPDAAITNAGLLCREDSPTLDVALTGVGPWELGYTNGPELQQVQLTEANVSLPLEMEGTVRLAWVTDQSSNCTRVLYSEESVFIADPTEVYFHRNLPDTVCDTGNGTWVSVVLKGKAPWTVNYTITNGADVQEVVMEANKSEYVGQDKVIHHFKIEDLGIYRIVSVSDACTAEGLIDPESQEIRLARTPTAGFVSTEELCEGSDVNSLEVALGGEGPWELNWTVDGENFIQSNITEPVFNLPADQPGSYRLTGVRSACEGAVLPESEVIIRGLPEAEMVENGAVLCDAESENTISVRLSGTGPYSFAYTRDGQEIETIVTEDEEYILPVTAEGTYGLAWVENSCGRGDTQGEVVISPDNATTSSISYQLLTQSCNTATLAFEPELEEDNYEYRWYIGSTLIGQERNVEYFASTWNPILVSLKVTNGICTDSVAQYIDVESFVAGKLGRFHWDQITSASCQAQEVAFSSDSTNNQFAYAWSIDGQEVSQEALFSQTLEPGDYEVKLVLDDGSCLYSSQQTVTIEEFEEEDQATFQYEQLHSTGCDVQMVHFTAGNQGEGVTYRWVIDGEEISQEPEFNYELPAGETTVALEVAFGECMFTGSQSVSVVGQSLADKGNYEYRSESLSCSEWQVVASALDRGDGITYQWWVDSELRGEERTLQVTLAPGEHWVQLRTESGSCDYEEGKSISLASAESLLNVPNVLSPNAAHPDDQVVKVYGKCISDEDFHFQVIDRWGGMAFETKSLEVALSQGWDGGNNVAGIYTYILRGRFDSGTTFSKQGTITLLK